MTEPHTKGILHTIATQLSDTTHVSTRVWYVHHVHRNTCTCTISWINIANAVHAHEHVFDMVEVFRVRP